MGDFLGDSYITLERDYYERALKNSYKKAAWTLPVTILNTVLKFGIYAVLIYAALKGGITVGSIAKYVTCIILRTHPCPARADAAAVFRRGALCADPLASRAGGARSGRRDPIVAPQ